MSFKRAVRWDEGQALCQCDVCGFPYRYPGEMVLGSNRRFYCLRTCWLGETEEDALKRASDSQRRREEPTPTIGRAPDYWA